MVPSSATANVGKSERTAVEPGVLPGEVAYTSVEVAEAVERVQSGAWLIPDFQREFVWKPYQLAAFADSLWRNYPVGSLLLWAAPLETGHRASATLWIADGQQRLTALGLLMGRRPSWWPPHRWESKVLRKYQLFVNVEVPESPFRLGCHPASVIQAPSPFVPLRELLELVWQPRETVEKELRSKAERLKGAGLCSGQSVESVAFFLASVI